MAEGDCPPQTCCWALSGRTVFRSFNMRIWGWRTHGAEPGQREGLVDALPGGQSLPGWEQVEVDGHLERLQWLFEVLLSSEILRIETLNLLLPRMVSTRQVLVQMSCQTPYKGTDVKRISLEALGNVGVSPTSATPTCPQSHGSPGTVCHPSCLRIYLVLTGYSQNK